LKKYISFKAKLYETFKMLIIFVNLPNDPHVFRFCEKNTTFSSYLVATTKQTGSHGNEFTRNNRGTLKNGVFEAARSEIRIITERSLEVSPSVVWRRGRIHPP
jgi:hypothetical protein